MKPKAQDHWRLTWNPVAPAKYESAWSIFIKVMYHNYLHPIELADLIKKDGFAKRRINIFYATDSQWIDFEKFGSLLGVAPARLKTGFLDQLGIQGLEGSSSNSVRHCPECAKLGYHCTLFDLDFVGECPWHKVKLKSECHNCRSLFLENREFKDIFVPDKLCLSCGTPIGPFLGLPELNRLTRSMESVHTHYCVELIDWFNTFFSASDFFHRQLKSLLFGQSFTRDSSKARLVERDREIFIHYAKEVTPVQLNWDISGVLYYSKYSEWVFPDINANSQKPINDNEILGIYRAIRRHVYKSFVQEHRKYLKLIFSMDEDELKCLRYDKVCMPALAYLLWRLIAEGKCNVEELHVTHTKPQHIQLHLPDPLSRILPINEQLRWMYLSFFGIWRLLEEYLLTHKRVAILLTDKQRSFFETGILWDRISTDPIDQSIEPSIKQTRFRVIYPYPPHAKKFQHMNPNGLIQVKDELIDIASINNRLIWAWTSRSVSEEGLVFKFTYNEFRSKSHFIYLNL